MTQRRAYGLWDSPLTPRHVAEGKRLSEVAAAGDGQTVVWLEGRGEHGVLVASHAADSAPRDLTAELSVRATVGYGGGDFTVGHDVVIFVADNRLYRQGISGGSARPVTPAFGAIAAPQLSPTAPWVLFVQSDGKDDCLAIVAAGGTQWPVKLVTSSDFYMQPRWHPNGDRIAWISWDHPEMPWDGCSLWTAPFAATAGGPQLGKSEYVAGGYHTAIFQPEYSPDGTALAYISDESGWGHIYLQPLDGGETCQLTSGEVDYGRPAWAQGQRCFAFVRGGAAIACVRSERGVHRLQVIGIADGIVEEPLELQRYTSISYVNSDSGGDQLLIVASAPQQPARVLAFDLRSGRVRTIARSSGETITAKSLAEAEPVSWTSFDGETAHGLLYRPRSARFEGAGKPPLIVSIHGGPTSQVTAGFDPAAQFLATRGYAVLQVNYRGSTGYGREYMLKLRESWGIYDVEDSRTGALWLAAQGIVDERRRVIMGGSAGGYTVLQSLVTLPGFYTAGVCLFGVSNQFTLAADTHKFEERYTDSLLGPLPEAAALYRERSPIFHAPRIVDPIAVFQGEIDKVVPRAQSDEIVASLKARGVPHEYHLYPGEGHGWRKTETIEQYYTALDRFLRQYVVFA